MARRVIARWDVTRLLRDPLVGLAEGVVRLCCRSTCSRSLCNTGTNDRCGRGSEWCSQGLQRCFRLIRTHWRPDTMSRKCVGGTEVRRHRHLTRCLLDTPKVVGSCETILIRERRLLRRREAWCGIRALSNLRCPDAIWQSVLLFGRHERSFRYRRIDLALRRGRRSDKCRRWIRFFRLGSVRCHGGRRCRCLGRVFLRNRCARRLLRLWF